MGEVEETMSSFVEVFSNSWIKFCILGLKGLQIQRYKGLGDEPQQLYAVYHGPRDSESTKVDIADAALADSIFSMLMGEDVLPPSSLSRTMHLNKLSTFVKLHYSKPYPPTSNNTNPILRRFQQRKNTFMVDDDNPNTPENEENLKSLLTGDTEETAEEDVTPESSEGNDARDLPDDEDTLSLGGEDDDSGDEEEDEETTEILERLIPTNITEVMQTAYIDYRMSVIISRTSPDARDGFKPVQRRILCAMLREGLMHNRNFGQMRRCCRRSSQELSPPHGDASVYDTLVRLAQPCTKASTHRRTRKSLDLSTVIRLPPTATQSAASFTLQRK